MYQGEAVTIGATRMALGVLGASMFPTRITPPSGAVGGVLRYLSGGSLEILPNYIAGAQISGATAASLGYLLGTTEVFEIKGPAAFYVACGSAATTVIQIAWNFSSGGATLY